MSEKYNDIINLPHHISKFHKHMSMHDRSAQFSPFAALTGHEEAVKETARLTETKIILSEEDKAILNEKMKVITEVQGSDYDFNFMYFVPDSKKQGGKYIEKTGKIRRVDTVNGIISLKDRTEIEMEEILTIESEIFIRYSVEN